ncbi:unnamed protein product [Prorocentrum cordatum]|uniref:Uncharacterized protein n=1 Tax=Prorocentrum cordatum TaxID=2364126 RepID=A0ABN9UE03_9DINO|nr:unnamed protein product [Polarella glacialis]
MRLLMESLRVLVLLGIVPDYIEARNRRIPISGPSWRPLGVFWGAPGALLRAWKTAPLGVLSVVAIAVGSSFGRVSVPLLELLGALAGFFSLVACGLVLLWPQVCAVVPRAVESVVGQAEVHGEDSADLPKESEAEPSEAYVEEFVEAPTSEGVDECVHDHVQKVSFMEVAAEEFVEVPASGGIERSAYAPTSEGVDECVHVHVQKGSFMEVAAEEFVEVPVAAGIERSAYVPQNHSEGELVGEVSVAVPAADYVEKVVEVASSEDVEVSAHVPNVPFKIVEGRPGGPPEAAAGAAGRAEGRPGVPTGIEGSVHAPRSDAVAEEELVGEVSVVPPRPVEQRPRWADAGDEDCDVLVELPTASLEQARAGGSRPRRRRRRKGTNWQIVQFAVDVLERFGSLRESLAATLGPRAVNVAFEGLFDEASTAAEWGCDVSIGSETGNTLVQMFLGGEFAECADSWLQVVAAGENEFSEVHRPAPAKGRCGRRARPQAGAWAATAHEGG